MDAPYFDDNLIKLYHGDCRTVLAGLPESSIDTVITDPPYGLEFMGKDWDSGIPGVHFWQEIIRVARPGAFLLCFGGTRTFHRLTCAIEDAGWEIRDCMMWLYGSGFPKSLDISKAIDKAAGVERKVVSAGKPVKRMIPGADQDATGSWIKDNGREFIPTVTKAGSEASEQWNGWGTALKPAWEPIIVAMKPLDGTFAQNAQKHGVAGLNIDGSRIAVNGESLRGGDCNGSQNHSDGWERPWRNDPVAVAKHSAKRTANALRAESLGRFPANLLLDEVSAALLDEQSGITSSGAMKTEVDGYDGESNTGLLRGRSGPSNQRADTGGVSRFFYTAKASRSERESHNTHPTVKPLDLMEYLCKLTMTPTGGTVLDPFAGSGSTLLAARKWGRPSIGIELNEEYCQIVRKRLAQGVLFGATE